MRIGEDMINKEVVPAFDMLLEELERIIPDLNAQGKALEVL